MNKTILFFTLLLSYASCLCAQKVLEQQNHLVGMWQMCRFVSSSTDTIVVSTPILKIYDEDGTYTAVYGYNRAVTPDKRLLDTKMTISQQGRYNVESDSVYRELIDKHYIAPEMENTTTILRYRFLDEEKNVLVLQFTNTVTGINVKEMWQRVVPLRR